MVSKPKKILIIEDEKPLANALEITLHKAGYAVTVVYDGQAGVKHIRKDSFDVVLLDLMMPVMDGFQVLETLHGSAKLPPVIVLSNLTQPEDVKRVLKLGAAKFMVKSESSLSDILQAISQLL